MGNDRFAGFVIDCKLCTCKLLLAGYVELIDLQRARRILHCDGRADCLYIRTSFIALHLSIFNGKGVGGDDGVAVRGDGFFQGVCAIRQIVNQQRAVARCPAYGIAFLRYIRCTFVG